SAVFPLWACKHQSNQFAPDQRRYSSASRCCLEASTLTRIAPHVPEISLFSRIAGPWYGLYLILISAMALSLTSCGDSPVAPSTGDISAIHHVVFLIKENRTFDNYFGTFPGADGVTKGDTSNGNSVPLLPAPDSGPLPNLCNSWDCAMLAMNGGRMNGFDLTGSGLAPYTQVTQQEIP